jgi:hypothetical protein
LKRELPALPVAGTTEHLAAYGASTAKFTRAQKAALMAEWPAKDVRIRYDRIVYVTAQNHRNRLTAVFGPGGWAEVPAGDYGSEGGLVVQSWQLFIGGVAITQSLGECQWVSSNTKMTKGDAIEGAKSNALTRNCKGIMCQDWRDDEWGYQFTLREGVLVKTNKGDAWRKVTSPPAVGEKGIDDRSPNRHRYIPPTAQQVVSGHTRPGAAAAAQEQQQDVSTAILVLSEEPINNDAKQQIAQAMRTHQRSQPEVQVFLQQAYNIRSRTQIKKKDFADVLAWIRAPYDVDQKAKEGEVVE